MSRGSLPAPTPTGATSGRRLTTLGASGLSAQQYIPEAAVPPSVVKAVNLLVPAGGTILATVEGMPLSVTIDPALVGEVAGASSTMDGPAYELVWSSGAEERFSVTLPEAIVTRIARAVQPSLGTVPDDPTRSFLVELALEPLLDTLEGRLATSLMLLETRRAGTASHSADAVLVMGELDGSQFAARLRLLHAGTAPEPAIAIERLAKLLCMATGRRPDAIFATVPVLVALRAGAMRIRLDTLRTLAPGDVLIPDEFSLSNDEVLVVAGERLGAPARIEGHGIRLQAPLRPIRPVLLELGQMNDNAKSMPSDAASGLDEVEVTLSFELGRLNIELRDLKSIGPGYLFALGRDPAHAIDIVVNGRKIGHGEIVRIGHAIGVRATRLYGGEGA
jgi:type III secretion protein Q